MMSGNLELGKWGAGGNPKLFGCPPQHSHVSYSITSLSVVRRRGPATKRWAAKPKKNKLKSPNDVLSKQNQ